MSNVLEEVTFRKPVASDGPLVWDLIAGNPPLDPNSVYCNLLQCTHFSDTSIAATAQDKLAGFISGYRIPARESTLFIWQVAVSKSFRGMGLATAMLERLLARPESQGITAIETTITANNGASWALFEGFARKRSTAVRRSVMFGRKTHFSDKHDTEYLLRIGPFQTVETRKPVLAK